MIDFTFPGLIGRIERTEAFESKFVIPRKVDVWLPPQYDARPDLKFAVLYMHDGENLFDSSTSKFSHMDWGIDETMTRLMEEQKIRPTMVVGMWSTEKRGIEYMPQKLKETKSREKLLDYMCKNYGSGPVSDQYLRFIVDEVKPYVDAHYRTLTDAANTFVMGSSMGGLISMYAECEYPGVFSGAGCVSTPFMFGRGVLLDYLKGHLPEPENHKFYFDYGTRTLDRTYESSQLKADAIMEEHGFTRGVDWITLKFEGHKHSEVDWRVRAHIPLEFLLKPIGKGETQDG